MRLRVLLFGVCLLFGGAGVAPGQQPTRPPQALPLVAGARIRVKATSLVTPLVASFMELRSDTLIVFEESARGIWSFALDQVERLETTAGERGSHRPYVLKGALYGSGAGLVAGYLFASLLKPSDPTREYSKVGMALIGAAIGTGLGVVVASRFTAEQWTLVPISR